MARRRRRSRRSMASFCGARRGGGGVDGVGVSEVRAREHVMEERERKGTCVLGTGSSRGGLGAALMCSGGAGGGRRVLWIGAPLAARSFGVRVGWRWGGQTREEKQARRRERARDPRVRCAGERPRFSSRPILCGVYRPTPSAPVHTHSAPPHGGISRVLTWVSRELKQASPVPSRSHTF